MANARRTNPKVGSTQSSTATQRKLQNPQKHENSKGVLDQPKKIPHKNIRESAGGRPCTDNRDTSPQGQGQKISSRLTENSGHNNRPPVTLETIQDGTQGHPGTHHATMGGQNPARAPTKTAKTKHNEHDTHNFQSGVCEGGPQTKQQQSLGTLQSPQRDTQIYARRLP